MIEKQVDQITLGGLCDNVHWHILDNIYNKFDSMVIQFFWLLLKKQRVWKEDSDSWIGYKEFLWRTVIVYEFKKDLLIKPCFKHGNFLCRTPFITWFWVLFCIVVFCILTLIYFCFRYVSFQNCIMRDSK